MSSLDVERNLPLWQDLRAKFFGLVFDGDGINVSAWSDVWRLIVDHPWYQRQLDRHARRVLLTTRSPFHWIDDLKHDAMLILAAKLRRHVDLNIDGPRAEHSFAAWMRAIVTHDCHQALRRIRRQYGRSLEFIDERHPVRERWTVEERVELCMATERLPDLQRTVVRQRMKGRSVRVIARTLRLEERTTYRVLRRGVLALRKALADPHEDARSRVNTLTNRFRKYLKTPEGPADEPS